MRSLLLAVLSLAWLQAAVAETQVATWRNAGRAELEALVGTEFFGIYVEGRKCGLLESSLRRSGEGADARFIVEDRSVLRITSRGQETRLESSSQVSYAAEPPFAVVSGRGREVEGEQTTFTQLRRKGKAFELETRARDATRLLDLADPGTTLIDALAPALWIRTRPEVGAYTRYEDWSMADPEVDPTTMTVQGIEERELAGVQTRIYTVWVSTARQGDMGEVLFDESGETLSAVVGGLFELRREPAEVARDFDASVDLFVRGIAAVDKPLGDTRRLRKLVLKALGEGADLLASASFQSVARRTEDAATILTLGSVVAVPVTPAEVSTCLAATPECPAEHPLVRALASRAIGDAASASAKVSRLVSFVDAYVADSYSANAMSALEVIETPAGDCTEHAALFNALARAVGIPSREVVGLVYLGDDACGFGLHAWNEVVLDGRWIPVDPTRGQTRVDPGHIRLGTQTGTVLAMLGKLSLELVESELRSDR